MKQSKALVMIFAFVIALSIIFIPKTAQAAPASSMSTNAYFDPSFQYLDQGDSNIIDNGNQTVKITVSTIAKQTVASIGANVYLDRWNGTAWVQVNTAAVRLSGSNTNYYDGNTTFSITSGYYYRARTQHWINQSGVYEQGDRTTASILTK